MHCEVDVMPKEKVLIKLQRHEWPDEIEAKRRRRNRWSVMIVLLVLTFGFGWLFGSFLNKPVLQLPADSSRYQRLDAIVETLKAQWYFGKDIENLEQTLIDRAISGMIEQNGDRHTSYMSAEEYQQFEQSLGMGFVGIGVQYYTVDGMHIVERVFRNSPAEKYGVQPGDIIFRVNGQDVTNMEASEVADIVKGEDGTPVTIDFIRAGEVISKEIIRGPVLHSAFGQILANNIGYLEINQFGSSTSNEISGYLDDMKDENVTKLIIDLRDNGGGYLDALIRISSFFLPNNTIVIRQQYKDGSADVGRTVGNEYTNFEEIVILVNGNSASASEVLAAALQEQRGVKVLGTTSYGKGTVQVTRTFSDGSALKFTTAQWLTPNGNVLDGVGVIPDIEVRLHEVFYYETLMMSENMTFRYDSVSDFVEVAQQSLDFLGYQVNRVDGYFDLSTQEALTVFQQAYNLESTGELDTKTYQVLSTEVVRYWHSNRQRVDTQLQAAIEELS